MSDSHRLKAFDVVVVGSGFSGCITALILQRIGLNVMVVDKAKHPRLAIGESSTPAADFVLADLARRYDLPGLVPLSQYGLLKQSYPQLGCGLKRGFSYFKHQVGREFESTDDHSNELLVSASADDQKSDSHWYRRDIDAFLADQVQAAGIELLEGTEVFVESDSSYWRLQLANPDYEGCVDARFVVDASGGGQFLARHFKFENQTDRLLTSSICSYGHFRNVCEFRSVAKGTSDQHPFPSDRGATHHLFDNSWMWDLRFDNGITSLGLVQFPATASPRLQLDDIRRQYPDIERMLANAEYIGTSGMRSTKRLQRLSPQMAGDNWAMLPTTAGFIDPLHSTGIAHSMIGIERLAAILQSSWASSRLGIKLRTYDAMVRAELEMIDRLVGACYLTMGRFSHFVAATMLYFAAVSTWEIRRKSDSTANDAFLLAQDDEFIRRCEAAIESANTDISADQFHKAVRELIAPYNSVGLLATAAKNMYHHTAAR